MVNYQQAKVYMIWSPSTGLTYYGSTCQPLSQRMACHRSYYIKGRRGYTSSQVFEAGDAIIVLVEAVPCNNKEELKAHEALYIKENDCVNKNVPGRTPVEYYRDNKEVRNAHTRAYYHANREVLKAKAREKFVCPCGITYTRSGKVQHERSRKHQTWVAQQQQQ